MSTTRRLNLKTAEVLGLTIAAPPRIAADEIIE